MEVIKKISTKISKTLIIAFSLLIIGGLITYYQTKLNEIEIPTKISTIKANKTIKKGDVITGSYLKEVSVYKQDKLKEGITEMSQLIGKVAVNNIPKGKEITSREIKNKDNWFKEDEREIGITFKSFTDLVGGKAKKGDIVDIMVSYPPVETDEGLETKQPDIVVENIELLNVFNDNNISFDDSKEKNSFKPITILIKATKKQEIEIDKAKKLGRLYLKRHGNYMEIEKTEKTKKDKVIINGIDN